MIYNNSKRYTGIIFKLDIISERVQSIIGVFVICILKMVS
jgi:hypothetical protein